MGEADRKELIARLSGWLFGGTTTDTHTNPTIALMYKILERTDVSQEQAYRNAVRINRELELVPNSRAKTDLLIKTTDITEQLYDIYHKKTKHLPDDPDFWTQFDSSSTIPTVTLSTPHPFPQHLHPQLLHP